VTDRIGQRVCLAIWLLLLALLPVTSMPLVRSLLGSSTVAAPSILPLIVLVVIWLLPYVLRRGHLPRESLPLFGFTLVVIAGSLVSMLFAPPAYKDNFAWRQFAEALITLGIGISFYLVAATFPRDDARLRVSLRWINYGGGLVLLWSFAQAAAWFSANRYPDWMRDFNDLLSLGPLYRQRASGFSLEPSWLAHQLNTLYLPLWLGLSITRQSVHQLKLWRISLENLLLVGGVIVLGLSFSRVGFLAFAAVGTVLFIIANRWVLRRAQGWLEEHAKPGSTMLRSRTLPIFLTLGLVIGYSVIIAGGLALFRHFDPRMVDLFRLSTWQQGGFVAYANQLQFGERAVYWQAGWNIFNAHPWLGVGLGSAGYYFAQHLPSYAWNLIEVQRLMFHSSQLLNIKSLWVRLLAETGLAGFSVFVSWLTMMGWLAVRVIRSGGGLARPIAVAAGLVLVALVFEGFSVDSFALPYYWVILGLLSSAARVTCADGLVQEGEADEQHE